jgi:DNA processing protein
VTSPTIAHLAALASLPDAGPARLRWLLGLGEPAETWERIRTGRLGGVGALGRSGVPLRLDSGVLRRWRDHAAGPWPERMARLVDRLQLRVLDRSGMPPRLGEDQDPPAVLFEQGRPLDESAPLVAVVGTRRASPYGLRIAQRLGRELSEMGVAVVSGLALGIDAAAHLGALEGPTPPVAVIGAGHDRPCPSRNRDLARDVARSGTVLSEVPPGVPSAPWRFPARNRCIAALAHVLVVVESPPAGGSMLTVAEALDRDRVVMAVPGSVERVTSAGCHQLLGDGALVCTGSADVGCLLGLLGLLDGASMVPPSSSSGPRSADPARSLTALGMAVVDLVERSPMSTDGVLAATGVALGELGSTLAELEDAGWIRRREGWIEACERGVGT